MAMIKSALELALEKTKNLKVDEAAIEANTIKMEGRKAAGKFLEAPAEIDLAKELQAQNPKYRELFRKTLFDVLAAQIQLPGAYFDAEKLVSIGAGIGTLAAAAPAKSGAAGAAAEKKAVSLAQQIAAFLNKYIEEVKRVEQAIRNQWAPKLKEKERQMAARMGQDVRLDPMSDPEFAAFYKQNFENLRSNYSDALERAKAELAAICGVADEEDGRGE